MMTAIFKVYKGTLPQERIHKLCSVPAKNLCFPSSQGVNVSLKPNAGLTLTKNEAVSFVEDILKIKSPLTLIKRDPFHLLSEIQKHTKLLIPFTNMAYASKHGINMRSLYDTKNLMFQRHGGGCFTINSFTSVVIQHLGYQAYLIGGSLPRDRFSPIKTQSERALCESQRAVSEGHIGLIVQNVLHQGSLHLIEPGTKHPILQLLPLNFTKVSPEYQSGHYTIRLFKEDPGNVSLYRSVTVQHTKPTKALELEGKKWNHLITYRTLQPLSIADSERYTKDIFENRDVMPEIYDTLFISGFSHGRWTVVRGRDFIQYGSRPGLVTRKTMKSNEEMVGTINQHFPQYPPEKIADALLFWYPDGQ